LPFTRGQGGRPRGARNKSTQPAYDIFVHLGGPNGKRYAAQLHALACGKDTDAHVRVKALALIAPYVWGKPTEHLAVSGEDGGPIAVKFVDV